jgi:hypothetical protein
METPREAEANRNYRTSAAAPEFANAKLTVTATDVAGHTTRTTVTYTVK